MWGYAPDIYQEHILNYALCTNSVATCNRILCTQKINLRINPEITNI